MATIPITNSKHLAIGQFKGTTALRNSPKKHSWWKQSQHHKYFMIFWIVYRFNISQFKKKQLVLFLKSIEKRMSVHYCVCFWEIMFYVFFLTLNFEFLFDWENKQISKNLNKNFNKFAYFLYRGVLPEIKKTLNPSQGFFWEYCLYWMQELLRTLLRFLEIFMKKKKIIVILQDFRMPCHDFRIFAYWSLWLFCLIEWECLLYASSWVSDSAADWRFWVRHVCVVCSLLEAFVARSRSGTSRRWKLLQGCFEKVISVRLILHRMFSQRSRGMSLLTFLFKSTKLWHYQN